jgi:hypothetical protein
MELATLTTGGISAIVARKSQTIPLRTGSVSVDREPRLARRANTLTCLHMRRPRPYTPGSWKPRRSKPISIMRSNAMSVTRVVIMLSFVLWMSSTMQVDRRGFHVARIWGWDKSRRSVMTQVDWLFTRAIPNTIASHIFNRILYRVQEGGLL